MESRLPRLLSLLSVVSFVLFSVSALSVHHQVLLTSKQEASFNAQLLAQINITKKVLSLFEPLDKPTANPRP